MCHAVPAIDGLNLYRYSTFLPNKKGLIRPKTISRCCPFKIEIQFVVVIKLGKEKGDKKCTKRLRYLWL
jgi:hypothetical protein